MSSFRIKPLLESDIDQVVEDAGGCRAHVDSNRRKSPNADYLLGDAVVELKLLDEDGLAKKARQKKLAALFGDRLPERPVVVLDKTTLVDADQRRYDRILEGPIKTAVSSARKQLKQTRSEFSAPTLSILWIVNNGYTALSDEELRKIVVHRVRNDTSEIDGVVVSGGFYPVLADTFKKPDTGPKECLCRSVGSSVESSSKGLWSRPISRV